MDTPTCKSQAPEVGDVVTYRGDFTPLTGRRAHVIHTRVSPGGVILVGLDFSTPAGGRVRLTHVRADVLADSDPSIDATPTTPGPGNAA